MVVFTSFAVSRAAIYFIRRKVGSDLGARRRFAVSHSNTYSGCDELLQSLRSLDTAAICDADKMLWKECRKDGSSYTGIRLLSPRLQPIRGTAITSSRRCTAPMVGLAQTVQCTQRNDFLAVLRGLIQQPQQNHIPSVLMVDTNQSDRAVAGELFCLQAMLLPTMAGIVVDGPVRDTQAIHNAVSDDPAFRIYATSVTPYSGTTESPGAVGVPTITCGGVSVHHGTDIIVGDEDGIVVANAATFAALVPHAQAIVATEQTVKEHLLSGEVGLADLTNAEEHIAARLAGKQDSSLAFRV